MDAPETISVIPHSSRRAVYITLLLLVFGLLNMGGMQHLTAGVVAFPLDDAYIHGVFARNIAQGNFFHYNVGHPVAGSTSPLWTLMLALLYGLGVSPLAAAWIAGLGLSITLVWLMYRSTLATGAGRPFAVGAAMLAAMSPRILWSAASGMEVSLVMVLCLAAVCCSITYAWHRGWQKILPPILFGLAIGARPECAALFPVLILWMLWDRRQQPAGQRFSRMATVQRIGLYIGLWLAVSSMWIALNYGLSGTPLPLTFYVKTAQQGLGAILAKGDWGALAYRLFVQAPLGYRTLLTWLLGQDMIVGLPLLAVLLYRIWQSIRLRQPLPRWALPLLLLIAYPYIRGVVTGQHNHYGQFARYLAVLTPLYLLLLVSGLQEISDWLQKHTKKAWLFWLAAVTMVLAFGWYRYALQPGYQWTGRTLPNLRSAYLMYMLVYVFFSGLLLTLWYGLRKWGRKLPLWQLLLGFGLLFSMVEIPQWAAENAVAVKNVQQGPVRIAKVLQANGVKEPIATCDVGAMAFYNNAPVIDIIGLISPEITRLWKSGYTEETLLKALIDRPDRPGWLATYQPWNPWLVNTLLKKKWAQIAYIAPIEDNITCGPLGVPNMALLRLTIPPNATIEMIQ